MAFLRCPSVVGRDRERAAGDAALVEACSGRGGAVGFVGEAGIGKTRISSDLAESACQLGMRVLVGRAAAEFSGVALRPWSEALLAGTRGLGWPSDPLLAPYRGVLGLLVPHWRDASWTAPVEAPVVLGEALLRVLGHLAGDGGVLVVLDDLHWADELTLASLLYVVDHIHEIPAVLILLTRDEGSGPRLVNDLRRAGIDVSRLERLSADQTREMALRCGMGSAGQKSTDSEHALTVLVEVADGLPLVVEDLVAGGSLGGPQRFADLVRVRLTRLSPIQGHMVRAAALLGERVDWRVVSMAVGLDERAAASALQAAVAVDLLKIVDGEAQFRHALTRGVIMADVSTFERVEIASRLADACLAVMTPTVGRDVLAADLMVAAAHDRQAIDLLSEGSVRAEAAGQLSDAESLCARAYQHALVRSPERVLSLGVELVRMRVLTGRPGDADALGNELLARADGHDRARAVSLHVMLARACVDQAEWGGAEAHIASARSWSDDSVVLAELAILDGLCALGADRPGQRIAVEHQAAKAVEMARRAGIPRLECEALMLVGRVARQRDLATAADALEEALRVVERSSLAVERLRVLDELGTVEMLRDGTADRLERAYAEAMRVGAFGAAASAGVNLASAYAMTGSHARCIALATDVGVIASRVGIRPLEAACEFMVGLALAFSGERAKAEGPLGRAEHLAPHDADLRAGVWAIGHGVGALVDDDRARARRAFARSNDLAPQRHARILDASLGPGMLLDALEELVTSADVRSALEGQVRGARWSLLWLGAATAVALAYEGAIDDAASELRLALNAGARFPLFGALVRRLAADAAIQTAFVDPVDLLRDAESAFDALGLTRASEGVRATLRSLGHPAPRQRAGVAEVGDELRRVGVTAREAEVLALLGERRTNREIAALLFVSAKTVEKHVAALTVKLRVANRVELGVIARTRT